METEHSSCFLCWNNITPVVNGDNNWRIRKKATSQLENQLDVIFILRNLLKVPSIQLERQLKICGNNPEDWIDLCDQCIQLTDKARELHQQIKKLEREMKLIERQVVEKITSADDDETGKEGKGAYQRDLMEFQRMIRSLVKHNKNYDDDNHGGFLEGDKLAKCLASQQNSSTAQILMVEKPVDEEEEVIKSEVESSPPPSPSPSSPPPMSPTEDEEETGALSSSENSEDDDDDDQEEYSIKITGNSEPIIEKMEVDPLSSPLMSPLPAEEEEEVVTLNSSEDYDKETEGTQKIKPRLRKARIDHCNCLECGKLFPDGPSVKNHVTLVHGTHLQKYDPCICNCPHCGKQYSTRISLESHVRTVHLNPVKIKCPLCDKEFCWNRDKNVHMLIKHKDDPVTLKLQEETGISLIKCPLSCRSLFLTTKDLDRHFDRWHVGVNRDDTTSTKKSRITEDGKFECGICGKLFHLARFWSDHQWKGHNVKEVSCPVVECSSGMGVFTGSNEYQIHWNTVHKKKKRGSGEEGGPWICDICGVEKCGRDSLWYHRKSAHLIGGKVKQVIVVNGKEVEIKMKEQKRKEEEQPVLCSLCGKELKTKYCLQLHIKFVHDKSFNFNCHVCGLGIATRGRLNIHLLTMHVEDPVSKQLVEEEGLELRRCEVVGCTGTFLNQEQLDKHVERLHKGGGGGGGGNERFKCEVCGKGFWRRSLLKEHEITHETSTERNWKCEICGKGFGSKTYLSQHEIKVHKKWKRTKNN